MFYKSFFKRALDISASGVGLICASPILVIVIVWLHFANKGAGVFFFQERPGKGARIFKVVKFKTMTDEKDADGNLLSDERRLTRVGRFVRSTSLDELPQLFNVLKGDMSLIGPRPLLVQYLPLYSPEQARRHEVRPGITGWAQCHGRNAISWTKEVRTGCVVCRSYFVCDGYEDSFSDNQKSLVSRGHLFGDIVDYGAVRRQ